MARATKRPAVGRNIAVLLGQTVSIQSTIVMLAWWRAARWRGLGLPGRWSTSQRGQAHQMRGKVHPRARAGAGGVPVRRYTIRGARAGAAGRRGEGGYRCGVRGVSSCPHHLALSGSAPREAALAAGWIWARLLGSGRHWLLRLLAHRPSPTDTSTRATRSRGCARRDPRSASVLTPLNQRSVSHGIL